MTLIDFEGRIFDCNDAFRNMLGYTGDELSGIDFKEITHPDDIRVDKEHAHELFECKRDSYNVKKRYIRKDGQQI